MTPFEVVLRHRYGTGAALDSSGFDNSGRIEGDPALGPGPRPGTGALVLDGVDDRVVVPPSASLRAMTALRVDATVRLDELGGRRTIVEGQGSFSLLVEPDGTVEGTIYDGTRWEGVRSRAGTMPVGSWVTVTYVFDGADTSALHLDGELVGLDRRPLGPMDPVDWPFGLNVGGWPDGDRRMFAGAVESLTLRRRAP